MSFRSLLFVPGSRPDRIAKALAAGADAVCIDLEDAVAPGAKATARDAVAEWLMRPRQGRPAVGVRVNGPRSEHGAADLEAVAAAPPLDFVMLPKAERLEDVSGTASCFGRGAPPIWPLIESAEGLHKAWDIAAAPGVGGVLFGGADYAADLGCTLEWEPLLYARGLLAAASARAGVELLDVPHLDVRDTDALEQSTRRAKAMGFTGRACIHPDQVGPVNAVFSPAEAEVAHARRVVQAFREAKGAAALLDGKLIEKPVIRAAERVLERAQA